MQHLTSSVIFCVPMRSRFIKEVRFPVSLPQSQTIDLFRIKNNYYFKKLLCCSCILISTNSCYFCLNTIYVQRHYFRLFSLQFQIVSYVRMHALETFPLKCFSEVTTRFKCRQNACFRKIVFKIFSAVPNRFKYVRMHDLETFVYDCFSEVTTRFKYRQRACLSDIVFIFILCSSKPSHTSECMLQRHCFQIVLRTYKSFQIVSDCKLYLVFKMGLAHYIPNPLPPLIWAKHQSLDPNLLRTDLP